MNKSCRTILDALKTSKKSRRMAVEKAVAVVQTRCDECVDKCFTDFPR